MGATESSYEFIRFIDLFVLSKYIKKKFFEYLYVQSYKKVSKKANFFLKKTNLDYKYLINNNLKFNLFLPKHFVAPI